MAFKFHQAGEGFQSNLALFDIPPVETATEKVEYIEYRPVGQLSRGSPLEFNISGVGQEYISLKDTRLYIKARILKQNGVDYIPVTDLDHVGFINLPLQSIWRSVDVSLQQQVISPNVSTCYPYKAICDVLLANDIGAKQSQLQSQLYYKDTAGSMEERDPTSGQNFGLTQRWSYTKEGNAVCMEGPIYMDILQQDRLLLNGVEVGIKFHPSSARFSLMSDSDTDEYHIEIVDAVLKVCKVKTSSGILVGHDIMLQKQPAIYPFMKSEIKTFSIAAGLYNFSCDDLFLSRIPSQMLVFLTSSEGFSGSNRRNPFNFANYSLNYLCFEVDGNPVPHAALQPNFVTNNYVSSYLTLYTGNNKYGNDEGLMISREDYPKGYAIYLLDIDGKRSSEFVNLVKHGHTRLSIRFNEPLSEPVTIIAYAKFPSTLQIDKSRRVIM